ncbi:N-acetylmuramoyl-L-alanine amidase [Glycomyces paridis]|uniref:N-acetylmuramoyl-L-alanine amidase n=1 Tax=Glycomyces paridis TaxID=2126555 RepID=A0A4S8PHS9_9ACTN|nr:peptidoglycan recognition family protein [Glycomyces paridis]THV27949.1 N-acetylmuramoyl-L-alanine amidase [Glycomyces paridis]
MSRWTDLATWRGPTPHKNAGKQTEVRGLVVHIAAGWYDGTIDWQKNPKSKVSSHFVVSRKGEVAQMVDTADAAWTQRSGNGEWLSVECEGFIASDEKNPGGWERLTDAQLDAVARLLARCHTAHAVPLQVTSSATGRGLGHHSMGADWGHKQCPGAPIIAQKPAIVARAAALTNGDDDMPLNKNDAEVVWSTDGLIPAPATALKTDPRNTHWAPASYLQWTYASVADVKAEQKAARLRDEAILAAVKGLDTAAVLAAVKAAAAADVKRDAELIAELRSMAAGHPEADAIVDALAVRLTNRE